MRSPTPVLPEDVEATINQQRREAREAALQDVGCPETIHVVLAIDEAYAPHAGVAIASAIDHAIQAHRLAFHILEDGTLSQETKAKLREVVQTSGAALTYVPVNVDALNDLPLNRAYISKATYYRLLMPRALPRDIKKIIYIDADTVVTDSLEKLWAISLDGNPIGACADEGGITQSRRLQLDPAHVYFNAGVAIFDLTALQAMDFETKALHAYNNNAALITLQDQDILNIVFCGQTKLLPLRWNANTRLFVGSDLEAAYSPAEAYAAAAAPGILHFTDIRKPWTPKGLNPMGYLYWTYRNQTAWREGIWSRLTRRLHEAARCILNAQQRRLGAQHRALRRQRRTP